MGLQDRDYYWEKYKHACKSRSGDAFASPPDSCVGNRPRESPLSGRLRYLLYPGLMLGSLWCAADDFLERSAMPKPPVPPAKAELYSSPAVFPQPFESVSHSEPRPVPSSNINDARGVVIKADDKGHFRGMVMINNVPMPFLIDTGATDTVVPAKMAIAAKLPYGRYVRASTAGGKISVRETVIDSLSIGNAQVHNLKAQMNDHLHEVLIGMSTLRYFKMTQSGGSMVLLANPQTAAVQSNPAAVFQVDIPQSIAPKVTTIKKTVSCDDRKVCVTKYSDR